MINENSNQEARADHPPEKEFKILVVDDNLQNIQVIGNMLKLAGYAVGFATDGKQALKILHLNPDYDLVLLDIDMPVMNGFEACIAIRGDETLKEIPIIFLTAFTDNEKIIAGFEAGAQDYVTKPFNSNELLARVNTHLQLKNKTKQLKELNMFLEQKIAERTEDLTEANIKIARLDRAKSDFLSLISHEMRTPLTGIIGLAQILKSLIKEAAQKEFVDYLVLSAQKLLKFSENALLITNLKVRKYDFSFETYDPGELADNIFIQLREKTEEKNLRISRLYAHDKLLISADKELFELSIRSILENAIAFSPEGGEITSRIEKMNDEVRISILDNGPGFSDEALTQVFQIFNATDMSHHSEGFGLSLPTVKLIMDLHKGRLEIKSNKTGTEVSLYIPFSKELQRTEAAIR